MRDGSNACQTVFDEVTDFLATQPSFEAIIDFKPSQFLDERLHELLDEANAGTISYSEQKELDDFLRVNHLLRMLKHKARLKLTGTM